MKVLVLLNGAAGTLAASKQPDETQRILSRFAELGVEAQVRAVPGEQLGEAARQAIASDFDVIAAGGGDGTLNAVASSLVGTSKIFAALPLGTMNHLAREMNIPLELERAVEVIARGRVMDLPVGQVNGRVFLSFSGMGIYSDIIRHRDAQQAALGRKKWPAMVVAFFRMLRRMPLYRARLKIGDDMVMRMTPLVFVALSDYQMRLFGVKDYACDRRSSLSVFIARRVNQRGFIALLLRSMFGLLRPARDFEAMCIERFALHLRRRHVRVAIDGEVIDLATPLRYEMCPRPLRMVLPDEATVE